MPRTICEWCHKFKIVYRIYTDNGCKLKSKFGRLVGPKFEAEICQKCAETAVEENAVFNLRRILRKELGTAREIEAEDGSDYFL